MGIDKYNQVGLPDQLGMLGHELKFKEELRILVIFGKTFLEILWNRPAELLSQTTEDVPGDAVVLAVRVTIADEEDFF